MIVSIGVGDCDDYGNWIEFIVVEGDWCGGGDK